MEQPDPFDQEIVDDLFKDLEHKKTKHPYVEPQVKDAQTIETRTQATNNEFLELKQDFDKVNDVATELKSQTDAINLIDDILDEGNLFNNISTEDIWREDDLFDNDDTQTIKNVSKVISDVAKPDGTVFDDINFKINEPVETITIPDSIEIINIEDDIDIPSVDGIVTDTIHKVKIITTNSNQLHLASNRIKKKYLRQK